MKIKLLVADDHAVVREGIATILKGSDIQVVGTLVGVVRKC